jgi:hypothetical protein
VVIVQFLSSWRMFTARWRHLATVMPTGSGWKIA